MNITITARKFELGDSLREKVEKKLKKLDKYFTSEAKANVTITRERDRETVELTIYQGSLIFRAQSTTKDMMESLSEDIDIVERQIRKNKTRLEKRLRSGFDKTEIDVAPAEPIEEEGEFNIVKVKKFPLKPMTAEEAILQMNMLNHNFFTFKSISGVYSIVYRRKDGNYAIIEAIE
ncbi:MAG: ribosome-associated translation inhibitor RaiA [Clostridia bacterium]|nr:ribosome-associated translation inhibitor RaiA [Clostridia bacterium]